eukprot:2184303-Pleurochrysis_carterae.AAC.2
MLGHQDQGPACTCPCGADRRRRKRRRAIRALRARQRATEPRAGGAERGDSGPTWAWREGSAQLGERVLLPGVPVTR